MVMRNYSAFLLLPMVMAYELSSVLLHREHIGADSAVVVWRNFVKHPGSIVQPLILRGVALWLILIHLAPSSPALITFFAAFDSFKDVVSMHRD